jgi:hypothetical protein
LHFWSDENSDSYLPVFIMLIFSICCIDPVQVRMSPFTRAELAFRNSLFIAIRCSVGGIVASMVFAFIMSALLQDIFAEAGVTAMAAKASAA